MRISNNTTFLLIMAANSVLSSVFASCTALSICCALCPFAVTRTACTHCTACSCLRASGTEWDYIVSYSLCCTLVWCVRGLSCSTVSWAHLGNVTDVKCGEPGAYYVTLFLQFGNRRLLARPGLCRTIRRGHNITSALGIKNVLRQRACQLILYSLSNPGNLESAQSEQ